MKRIKKYETPDIEFIRFDVDAALMTVYIPGGGDGDIEPVPGEGFESGLGGNVTLPGGENTGGFPHF